MEGSEVPCECCELNLEPLKEQPMLWLLSCLSSPKTAFHVDRAGQTRGHTKDDEGQALAKTIPYVCGHVCHSRRVDVSGQFCDSVLSFRLYMGSRDQT